jgi:large subunit ribosomal protein L20
MPRVKRGTMHNKRRRNILKTVKGFQLGRKKLIKLAKTAATKAGQHAYRDRKKKKRNFRQLWNIKINAGARQNNLTYSQIINKLKTNNITLNRKILADLAEHHPYVFKKLCGSI